MKFLCANRISPDGTLRSAASHLGLYCLPMSRKKDARLRRVKVSRRDMTVSKHTSVAFLTSFVSSESLSSNNEKVGKIIEFFK